MPTNIDSIFSSFMTIPSTWENGEIPSELEKKFQAFADFIWNNTYHDEDAVKPFIKDDELSGISSPDEVKDNLQKAERMVKAFHLSRKMMMSEDFRRLSAEQVEGMSIIEFFKKYGYTEDDFFGIFKQEGTKSILDAYGQYAEKIRLFVEKVHAVQANSQAIENRVVREGNPIPYYFERVRFKDGQLTKLFDILLDNQWLDSRTNKEDFIYFFSGVGKEPTKRLKWVERSVILSLFLKAVSLDSKLWLKASKIFLAPSNSGQYLPVKADSIRSNFSSAQCLDTYKKNYILVNDILNQI